MKNRHVFFLVGLIVLITFLIEVAWEFKIEELIFTSFLGIWDTAETFRHRDDLHRWEYVISTTCLVAIALIIPTVVLMLKIISEREQVEELTTRFGRTVSTPTGTFSPLIAEQDRRRNVAIARWDAAGHLRFFKE